LYTNYFQTDDSYKHKLTNVMKSPKDNQPDSAGTPELEATRASRSIPATRYDLKILQSLRQIMRATDIHSRKLRTAYQITAPQLVCLIAIVENNTLTLKQIAEQVYLSPSTVVGILDRLEARGLILRLRGTRDRRIVNVTATEAARHLVQNAPSPLQEGLAESLTKLAEIEQATIALSLQRVVELMSARDIDAAPLLDAGGLDANEPPDETM
jgi:DNA-binding MarR family transcriptional regulator